jgi:EAL and modified HD-GYP domain-containing signal transduction protein
LKDYASSADELRVSAFEEIRNFPVVSPEPVSRHWPAEVASLVRQPILDESGLVHGYELILETGEADFDANGPRNALTVLENIVLFGLDRLTGVSRAFFNCSAEALTEDVAAVVPADMTVLQIPATLEISARVCSVCKKLKAAGFRFALVDPPDTSQPHPLLDLVRYVKLDAIQVENGGWASLRRSLKNGSIALVASGVHSQDSYRKARGEGFTYFQGYYFCRPRPLKSAGIPANRLVHVEILRELFKDPLDLDTLCPLVMREVALVCHVLRLVNSPLYALRGTITSIKSAILILGDVSFRRIATLAIQCALNDGKPREILHTSLVRARFCAESADSCNLDANEQYLLGMLSMLPAMMGLPMESIVPELPVRDALRQALLGFSIHERCLLDWIECHEANQVAECHAIADHYKLDLSKLMQSYVDALVWAGAEHAIAG